MNKKLWFALPILTTIVVYLWAMNGNSSTSSTKRKLPEAQESNVPAQDATHLTINWGASARQGRKPMMEDRYFVALPLTPEKQHAFFGVYDGHVGDQAADYVMHHLHENLIPRLSVQANSDNNQALKETFEHIDQELFNQKEQSGTTATVAYMQRNDEGEDTVSFAWVGDSRAIMANKNDIITFSSTDHRPDNPDEELRTGGKLKTNLTRSLGNFIMKNKTPRLLIATPELATLSLAAGDIIIMASDGLWDTPGIDNGIVMSIVDGIMDPDMQSAPGANEIVFESGNSEDLQLMARKIRDIAYQMGSKDNIAVMVIRVET